jgi:hypothetical protein
MRKMMLAGLLALAMLSCGKADVAVVKRPLIPFSFCNEARKLNCGKGAVAIVKRPVIPIHFCNGPRGTPCGRFDAGPMIGMKLNAARRLAKTYGFTVRRVAPLRKDEGVLLDAESNRIDVECNAPSDNSFVVRIMGLG